MLVCGQHSRVCKNVRLAVSAPWRVELNENIPLIIENDVLVIVRNDDLDWAVVGFRDRLRLDARLDLACNKVIEELSDILLRNLFTSERELLVLDSLLDGKRWEFAFWKVQVGGMSSVRLRVDGGEVYHALMLGGNGLEEVHKLGSFFWSLGEDIS